jgi:hypothetical protein
MGTEMLNPRIHYDGMVFYGDNGINVSALFGIDPEQYLTMHQRLADIGLRVRLPDPAGQVDFVLYCHNLINAGADVTNIIREYNVGQRGDGTDFVHALSLTKLFYHYYMAGRDVSVCRTLGDLSSPDLIIDGLPCELKVRIDQTQKRMEPYRHLLFDGKQDEYMDILFNQIRSRKHDLETALLRARDGFEQGDCVFLDISSHFHSWNYHRIRSLLKKEGIHGVSESPLAPISGSCILFSPDNAWDRNNVGFNPRAYWGYLPLVLPPARRVVPESP